jgi:NADH-quinone oxidoreductase subunit H
MFVSSAVISALYFGGYNFPGMDWVAAKLGDSAFGHNVLTIMGTLAFLGKTFFFIFFYMWVRWTVPRFRYDQLMNLGWVNLIPLAIFNVMATGAIILFGGPAWLSLALSWATVVVLIIGLTIYTAMSVPSKKLSSSYK